MSTEVSYVDDFSTCARTYATLCLYSDRDVASISHRLGIEPSRTSAPSSTTPAAQFGWFLSSDGAVTSRDLRRHLDWLIDLLAARATVFRELLKLGVRGSVSCFWLSRYGHGGPIVSVAQLKALAELEVDLEFDIYLGRNSEAH